jgi:hypothetical protein
LFSEKQVDRLFWSSRAALIAEALYAELRRIRTGQIVLAGLILMLHHTAEWRRRFFTRPREVAIIGPFAIRTQWRL